VSDAFLCDFCLEYKDGEPAAELYGKRHIDRQGTEHPKLADACQSCANRFGLGGEP
jgi:hypothetical protein